MKDENEKSSDMVDINKNIDIPKLHFRPKSADGNFYRGSQTSPDMKYRRETHSKSALDCYENERIKKVNIATIYSQFIVCKFQIR